VKVWIDPEECTGDGLCVEIAPDVFVLELGGDRLAYVRESADLFGTETEFAPSFGHPCGLEGQARVPTGSEADVRDAERKCPGECIFIVDEE